MWLIKQTHVHCTQRTVTRVTNCNGNCAFALFPKHFILDILETKQHKVFPTRIAIKPRSNQHDIFLFSSPTQAQTGLGRTGDHYWSFESHDVIPDIGEAFAPLLLSSHRVGSGRDLRLRAVYCFQQNCRYHNQLQWNSESFPAMP